MEDKTRKLVLALEGLALATALILILIDYKLKNDLVALYRRMEESLADGQKLFANSIPDSDTGSIPGSNVVAASPAMETATHTSSPSPNGKTSVRQRTPAKRDRRTGDTPIPRSDNTVGP
jgi:hypothetical protein